MAVSTVIESTTSARRPSATERHSSSRRSKTTLVIESNKSAEAATLTAKGQKGLTRMRFGRKQQQQQQDTESVKENTTSTPTSQTEKRPTSRRTKQVSWNNNSLFRNIDDSETTSTNLSSSKQALPQQQQQQQQSNDQRGDSVSRRHGDGKNHRRRKSHSAPDLSSAFNDNKNSRNSTDEGVESQHPLAQAQAPAPGLQTSTSSLPPYLDYSNVHGRDLWYTDTELQRFMADYNDDKDTKRYIRNQRIKNKMLQAKYKWKN